ncbi:MAG: PKD domain-containing protein, partial [Bacteroidota bacterium]|nr:PKD domain-containing protein [Bacteroidota bacterium]
MPNGSGLLTGGANYSQDLFTVQKRNDEKSYYVFQMGGINPLGYTDGLMYSIVDMRLHSGLGDIVPGQKNIHVLAAHDASGALTGTRHHNNKDAWIITRRLSYTSQRYACFLVSFSGLDTVPVYSNSLLHIVPNLSPGNGIEYLKVSPDGTKLICVCDTSFEYCTFDSQTGKITPLFVGTLIKVNNMNGENETPEFSLKSKYLYLSCQRTNGEHVLYQFDATKTDSASFFASRVQLESDFPYFIALQRAVDNKIYVAPVFLDSLSVIEYPDNPGASCQYTRDVLSLQGRTCIYNLPQFLQKYKAYIQYFHPCQNDRIPFSGDIWPPADTTRWNFGDPASGVDNVSYLPDPVHIYSLPGTYTVEL